MNTIDKNRRDFLLLLVGGTLTTYTALATSKTRTLSPHVVPTHLSFVEVSGLGPPQVPEIVENNFCPLHHEKLIPVEAIPEAQRNTTKQLLKKELELNGTRWDNSFSVIWTSQHYGVPDESFISYELLEYCISAQEYLYRNLNGLFSIKPSWNILKPPKNCPDLSGNTFTAFVGRYTYLVIKVNAVNQNGDALDPYLINIRPLERSLNFIAADPLTYRPKKSTIYIIPGLTALCSPFSELLHLSTNQAALAYSVQLANEQDYLSAQAEARLFSETVTEAMSHTLARKFLEDTKNVKHLKQLNTLQQHMSEYLPDLEVAIGYCLDQGIQKCFDSFLNDPRLLNKKLHDYKKSLQRM